MHQIHTTPGFVIGSRSRGEAGKLISLFTRDFGLVMASAQGIRLEKSKLRYYIQDYSFGTFSLVRGKEFWRLTSAQSDTTTSFAGFGAFPDFPETRRKERSSRGSGTSAMIVRLASLLKRLLHGEEAHSELFDCVQSCDNFLIKNANIFSDERLQTLESLMVVRILNKLGYIGDVTELNGHIGSSELSIDLLDSLKWKRMLMNRHINKALKESHL